MKPTDYNIRQGDYFKLSDSTSFAFIAYFDDGLIVKDNHNCYAHFSPEATYRQCTKWMRGDINMLQVKFCLECEGTGQVEDNDDIYNQGKLVECLTCNCKGYIEAEKLKPDKKHFINIECKLPNTQNMHQEILILEDMLGLKMRLRDESIDGYQVYRHASLKWKRGEDLQAPTIQPVFTKDNADKVADYLNNNYPEGWQVIKC